MAEQDCSGISEISRFNASGEPVCEAVTFFKVDPSTKAKIPMTSLEARIACESAGPDGSGLCQYTRSPEGVWEDTQKEIGMVFVALVSIPLMGLLSFVDLWLRDLLCPRLLPVPKAEKRPAGGEETLTGSVVFEDENSLARTSSFGVATRPNYSSFNNEVATAELQSECIGEVPVEWLVLNVPDMTVPTPCFSVDERLSFASRVFQLVCDNKAYMEPYRRRRQSQQSVLKRALLYAERYPTDPEAYDIFDDVEGLKVHCHLCARDSFHAAKRCPRSAQPFAFKVHLPSSLFWPFTLMIVQ